MWFTLGAGILKFLTGDTVKSVTQSIASVYAAKANAELQLGVHLTDAQKADALKHYDFQIKALEVMLAVMITEQGWWVTRMIRPLFAYTCLLHFSWVALASMGWVGVVHVLPTPLDWLEVGIIGSYFALRPFEKNKRADIVAEKLK